jgi:hypothetical protein
MEFDLVGESRSGHWGKGGGSAKGNFWLDSALEGCTMASLTPGRLRVRRQSLSLVA